jgi:hypothetical protein
LTERAAHVKARQDVVAAGAERASGTHKPKKKLATNGEYNLALAPSGLWPAVVFCVRAVRPEFSTSSHYIKK